VRACELGENTARQAVTAARTSDVFLRGYAREFAGPLHPGCELWRYLEGTKAQRKHGFREMGGDGIEPPTPCV
jgi:hypothetical protein